MTPRGRTAVVALLVSVVGVRVSDSQPLTAAAARVASDPGAALGHAADGWTFAGTLGGASAQGLREIPLALYYWLGSQLGLSAQVIQTSWRVLVLLLALGGAIRLARALSPVAHADTWTPWVAALLFSSGIVLVPTLVRSPLDGLAAATLPWIVAPLLRGPFGWRQATVSAAWLGLAGVGSPSWACAALVAGVVAAVPRARDQVLQALLWLVFAAMSCAWWVSAVVWEQFHARDVSALLVRDGLGETVAEAVGRNDVSLALVLLVALGPVLVTLSALLLRPPGADRVFLVGLSGAGLGVIAAWLAGWDLPLFGSPASDPPASAVAPVLGWFALTALVAWTPLVAVVGVRLRSSRVWRLPSDGRELAAVVLGVMVMVTTGFGTAAAAAQPGTSDETDPGLATQVASWSDQAPPGRVLVLPAQSDDDFTPSLGSALGERPWIGRDTLPASGAAGTSALDDLLGRLARGDGGPGTSSGLRSLGITYVLVHSDGSFPTDRANPTAFVRAALEAQGARRVARLAGPELAEEQAGRRYIVDFGVRSSTEQVEIWSVAGTADGWIHPGSPVDVVGDPGTVSDLADAGVLGSQAVRIRGASAEGAAILSDSARRRDLDQRVTVDPFGPALGPKQPRSVVPPGAAPVTTATRRVGGARSVSASSSAADLDGDYRRPGTDAMAAVDANVFTSWQSRRGAGVGEWWEINLEEPTELYGTTVQFVRNQFEGRSVSRVEVTTDQGAESYAVTSKGLLTLEGLEQSSRLRITVTRVKGTTGPDDSVGIAEVRIPGVTVRDELVVAGPTAPAWVMAARTGSFAHCVPAVPTGPRAASTEEPVVCDRGLTRDGPDTGSIDRVIDVAEPSTLTGRVWARAADSDMSSALADRLARPTVTATASSVAAPDLVTRPQAVADADPSTAWRPAPEDTYPSLTLTWPTPTEVTGVRLTLADGDVASVPTRVRVAAEKVGRTVGGAGGGGAETTDADVLPDGSVEFPRVRTRSIRLTFLEDSGLTSVGSLTGAARSVPIAIAEVSVVGGPEVRYDSYRVHRLKCGSGPTVSIGGKDFKSAVTTSAHDVVAGARVPARVCGEADLPPREAEVEVPASFSWTPLGLVLSGSEGALGGIGRSGDETSSDGPGALEAPLLSRLQGQSSVRVSLDGATGERTLALAVPAGTGWEARSGGERLRSVTVNGWSQGWAVPAGVARAVLRYPAGGVLRGWVVPGAAGWALVVLLAAFGAVLSRRPWSRWSR